MSQSREPNLALFLDFDNVAIGARDARQRFNIGVVLGRLLEKGKIVVKKAYADWSYYKDYMNDLHGAAIELIEVPSTRMSGKNSADIRMVVDAMDLCYSKDHIDIFVIISGDSDFSPLVSKLRENNKAVIGMGVKGSTSELLINNCDEFIFYDDLVRSPVRIETVMMDDVPSDKKKLFNLVVETIEGLLHEHKGVLYSSLIKDTMKRKKPDFSERAWGFSSFSDLLEEAMAYGLLTIERDERAGGSFVVTRLGGEATPNVPAAATRKSSRRRRRRGKGDDRPVAEDGTGTTEAAAVEGEPSTSGTSPETKKKTTRGRRRRSSSSSATRADAASAAAGREASAAQSTPVPSVNPPASAESAKKATKKAPAKKAPAKKPTTKKTTAVKPTKKAPAKKTTAKKTTAKKTTTKKAPAKKAPAKKTTTKKTTAKKTTARKA